MMHLLDECRSALHADLLDHEMPERSNPVERMRAVMIVGEIEERPLIARGAQHVERLIDVEVGIVDPVGGARLPGALCAT